MSYLIDSDWLVAYLLGRPAAIAFLDPRFTDGLAISIITYAEVYQGIYFGRDPTGAEICFRSMQREIPVLGISRPIARRCARLRGILRDQGMSIPQPYLFIAATAIERDLTLLTRNVQHFGRIPDLRLHQSP